MVSSTFTDLQAHRAELIEALRSYKLYANAMENDSARLVDVLDSSLEKVRESVAYIGVISRKYGQIPICRKRNPDHLSLTELEFNEAQRLGRPILLFIMGQQHQGIDEDFEKDSEKRQKLDAFRERAKMFSPDSDVHRVYAEFNSLADFKDKLGSSLAELKTHLDSVLAADLEAEQSAADGAATAAAIAADTGAATEDPGLQGMPTPPALYAQPPYIGSHKFVGRAAELELLSDWAQPADPTQLLLFEAIGGNGKSMLTWEWTTHHAVAARPAAHPWAGRFWYSFYERGARMADFCQHALAYITARPLAEFEKKTTAELREPLLAELTARPWLLMLDGLERVLVAYHRLDAAELPDEAANAPTDAIANRDPCDAIREEDNDLLRSLVAAAPSKLLISSRLTPRVLLNASGQPIPGAKRFTLPGLRPPDAEALLRSCEIRGESEAIQSYLSSNCDNHPLVIGILAGLIANHLPDRGNFDAWAADPEAGAGLDLASLDLIQRRNHILRSAIAALPLASRSLLSSLALLTDCVDYATLSAFNPHLPPEPEDKDPTAKQQQRASAAAPEAAKKLLQGTVKDLERRGLLQWDGHERTYGLHPVVRAVAAGGMAAADLEHYGQRVVDFFTMQPTRPYDEAETLEDVRNGLQVVRTLLKLGRFEQAAQVCRGGLNRALFFNLEAYSVAVALLRGFFPAGWSGFPRYASPRANHIFLGYAGFASLATGAIEEAFEITNLQIWLALRNGEVPFQIGDLGTSISSLSMCLNDLNRLATAMRLRVLSLEILHLSKFVKSNQILQPSVSALEFVSRLRLFVEQSMIGNWEEANAVWNILDTMGRDWPRNHYRPGHAEYLYACHRFCQGTLQECHLAEAERLALEGKNRRTIRALHQLRGEWSLEHGNWALAAASFQEAVRLARERSLTDAESETGLALARLQLRLAADPGAVEPLAVARQDAERLSQWRRPAHDLLARLWLALGDSEQAKHHALAAYRWAWADGEPYVRRYELTKATELLQQLNVAIPNLPPYDPAKDEPFPWEAEVRALLESTRAEQQGAENLS
jgi:hypothetical protein